MKKEKWYISGRITGLPADEVEEKFAAAQRQIEAFGHEAVSPLDNGVELAAPWEKHMAADLALLLRCDAVYMLTDWKESRGSRIESYVAKEAGIQVYNQPDYAGYSNNH